MSSPKIRRIRSATLAAAAVAVAATLSACSTDMKEKPTDTMAPSSPSSGAPAPSASSGPASPTEKKATPGGGANSFTPSVTARPAPSALPGNVITGS